MSLEFLDDATYAARINRCTSFLGVVVGIEWSRAMMMN